MGAVLALLHDPILIIGWFALSQTPFDLAVVAALLAVVGYSLNDTIIVFDRIRERFEANRRLAPALVLDQSINQTLSRTIMTKVTTLIVVVALLVLGGPALRGFSEALVIGILAGTYSSIYISAAIALDLGLKAEHVFPTVRSKKSTACPEAVRLKAVSPSHDGAAVRSVCLDRAVHAVGARDRSRHRQHHLHLDPGRAPARSAAGQGAGHGPWRWRCSRASRCCFRSSG